MTPAEIAALKGHTPGPYRWVSEVLDFVARPAPAETAPGDNLRPLPEPLRKPPTQEGQE